MLPSAEVKSVWHSPMVPSSAVGFGGQIIGLEHGYLLASLSDVMCQCAVPWAITHRICMRGEE